MVIIILLDKLPAGCRGESTKCCCGNSCCGKTCVWGRDGGSINCIRVW